MEHSDNWIDVGADFLLGMAHHQPLLSGTQKIGFPINFG